jgi:hypothetical protein
MTSDDPSDDFLWPLMTSDDPSDDLLWPLMIPLMTSEYPLMTSDDL